MEAVAEHQGIPKEQATVETIGVLEGRDGDRDIGVGRH